MTIPEKWITMDLQQAMGVLATHVPREDWGDKRVCAICRTWVEQDEHTLVPQWPCDEVRRARHVVGRAQPLPENRPPVIPDSIPSPSFMARFPARTVAQATVPVKKKERQRMAIELEVEPDKNHHGTVNVHVTDSTANLYETVDMPADDARLLGLKLIRAADASERRGW